MNSLLVTAALTCLIVSAARAPHAMSPLWQDTSAPLASNCRIDGELVPNTDLPEGSGVAASRRLPGVLWAHNDSGEPVIAKLDENGTTIGHVRITGAEVEDWEDIAVGRCPQESCIYVGDIGDNDGRRKHITVYRVPEPAQHEEATSAVEVFRAAYPDGAHDAESLFVIAASEVYIVTKGDPGPVALYRFPRPLSTAAIMQLERVGQPLSTGDVRAGDRPTAADATQDGAWVAVRTTDHVMFYRTADLLAGRWREAFRADLRSLREPRGEGIALGRNGMVFLVGEGGPLSRAGTFAKLTCSFQP